MSENDVKGKENEWKNITWRKQKFFRLAKYDYISGLR